MDVTVTSPDVLEKLELPKKGVEIAVVRHDGKNCRATVLLPDTQLDHFHERVEKYGTENTKKGNPRYKDSVTAIESFDPGDVLSLLVGVTKREADVIDACWWEVWVWKGRTGDLREVARRLSLTVSERTLSFPDREIVLVHCTLSDLQKIQNHTTAIAEIRLFRDTPGVYLHLRNDEQKEWNDEALSRLQPADAGQPSVLILDSGVNRAHPLLDQFIPQDGWLAWNQEWTAADTGWQGHGTAMAGLILHGDAYELLRSTTKRKLPFSLESVRILPPLAFPAHAKESYGKIIQEAVAAIEKVRRSDNRVICMAVTAEQDVFRGKPSSWSAALDQIAYGEEGSRTRLIVVSAGNNMPDKTDMIEDYMASAETAQIHSPAQAWNILTVGAFTERTKFVDPKRTGWRPVAEAGDLAPTSTTSVTWEAQWPLKPDVVFEGGNILTDGVSSLDDHDDVRLMTTNDELMNSQLRAFGDTSAAAALAAKMAGELTAAHPNFRPETIRALIAHSAEWTPAMKARKGGSKRQDVGNLVKRFGYGVPIFERAEHSLSNDVTLVIEQAIQPYDDEGKLHQMHLHRLPWEALQDVPENTRVQMRVTLSYFIEPNPSERSYMRRSRYASHGLRFAMKDPLEKQEQFVNRLLREETDEVEVHDPKHKHWVLGPKLRGQGSLHSDTWEGDISELRKSDLLAIYPVSGWWKEKKTHYQKKAPYSLLVTIRVPETTIDLYTPVAISLGIPIPTPVAVVTET